MRAGNYDHAEALLRAMVARDPDAALRAKLQQTQAAAAQAHFSRIDELVGAGDLAEAEIEGESAVYYQPEEASYRLRLAELYALRRDTEREIAEVRRSMDEGDWLGARERVEPLLLYVTTFSELEELKTEILRESYNLQMREGTRFLKITDYETSVTHFERALSLFPDDQSAHLGVKTARERLAARGVARDARELLSRGELENGLREAQKAQELHPESTYIESVVAEAYRQNMVAYLERESKAYQEGRRHAAFDWAVRAARLEAPQRTLRERALARRAFLQKELAAAYLAAGVAREKAGLVGAAWTYYRLGTSLAEDFFGLKERLEATSHHLEGKSHYRLVVVRPAEGERTAPDASARVAGAVREVLATALGAGVQVYSHTEVTGALMSDSGLPLDAAVTGVLEEFWIEAEPPRLTSMNKRYVSGRVPTLNPRVERNKTVWENMKDSIPEAQKNLQNVQAEVQKREADVKTREDALKAFDSRAGAVSDPAQQAQLQNDRSRLDRELSQAIEQLTFQRGLLIMARSTADGLEGDIEQALQNYLREPPYVFAPKERSFSFQEASVQVNGTAKAVFTLKDYAAGEEHARLEVRTTFQVRDTVVAGYDAAEIPEDPYDIPNDDELLDRLASEVAGELAMQLASQIKGRTSLLIQRARREGEAGNFDEELHYLVTAWQSRVSLNESEVAGLRARVLDLSGLDLESDDVDRTRMALRRSEPGSFGQAFEADVDAREEDAMNAGDVDPDAAVDSSEKSPERRES